MRHRYAFLMIALLAWPGSETALGFQVREDEPSKALVPSFRAEIEPILRSKCLRCHGDASRKADLDLSTPEGIGKGGESGTLIVPGKPDESLLFEKVRDGDMPPDGKDPLGEAQLDSLRRWIAAGAPTDPGRSAVAEAPVTQHDVLPILLRHCTTCHGLRQKQGGLDLRSRGGMLQGGKSGPALVLGEPGKSLLLERIGRGEMPPPPQLVDGSVKPVDPAEAEVLARWIKAGAPEVASVPDVATSEPDPQVNDADRDFWAFRAPGSIEVPATTPADHARNPIDAFIVRKLREKGLALSPEADRLVLLRRATFDLTGLPPSPEEVRAFLEEEVPDAYERLVDRLLDSPRYGERWGEYWLDLAGYADSEGKREQDLPRPNAWRYRDYVIRSLNSDKTYDRFLREQIAGDELADYESAPEITQEIADNLVATGFLRMAPDATWANITGYLADRVEVVADEIDVLGSSVMGLTLKCARCHDHKFDPIPQRDYYRLVDVLKGAYDEYDWLKPDVRPGLGPVSVDVIGGRLLPQVTAAERREWEANEARIKAEVESLRGDLERTKALGVASKTEADAIESRIKEAEAGRRPEPMIQALWDRGQPSPTYLYRRGDPLNPGRLIGPGVPSALTDGKTPFEVKPPWPGANKTGRRLAFAQWLTRADHPLTARVAVNRLWKHHFGSGIVKTLGNFGKAGTPPTHPELLDWLAGEFVRGGWSLKAMHRLILTSATYRQGSAVTPDHEKLDPDNALVSRMPMVRLDAESLYDSLHLVAGRLDEARFGPADKVEVKPDGLATPAATPRGRRRLIYVQHTRKHLPTHLENFDYPQMNPNCVERRDSVAALQALELMNSGLVYDLSRHFASRVADEAGADLAKRVERAYLIALGRLPEDAERQIGLDSLRTLSTRWAGSEGNPEEADRRALATYCHALMNSAAFLYVD